LALLFAAVSFAFTAVAEMWSDDVAGTHAHTQQRATQRPKKSGKESGRAAGARTVHEFELVAAHHVLLCHVITRAAPRHVSSASAQRSAAQALRSATSSAQRVMSAARTRTDVRQLQRFALGGAHGVERAGGERLQEQLLARGRGAPGEKQRRMSENERE
jgi:hypothetical protein